MALLGLDQILAAVDYKYEDVECPEWGGTVRIRSMGGHARDVFDTEVRRLVKLHGDTGSFPRELLVSLCAIDEQGALLFNNPLHVQVLGGKSPEVLERLFAVAIRLSGVARKSEEEIAKN